jgi:hypothetical protein
MHNQKYNLYKLFIKLNYNKMSVVDYSDVEGSYQDPPSVIIDTENIQVPLRSNDLSNRPVTYNNVAYFLREKTDKMSRCKLLPFSKKRLIGKGKNGLIYELKGDDELEIMVKVMSNTPQNTIRNKWEVYYSKRLTNIVLRNQSPHFPMVWLDDDCEDCEDCCKFIELDNFTDQEDHAKWTSVVTEKSCYLMFLEKFEKSLDDLIVIKESTVVSFVIQMMMAFSVLQGENLVHNDCHPGNVLIKNLSDYDTPYIGYRMETETIYVKHEDRLFVLSDFGMMSALDDNPPTYLPEFLTTLGIEDEQIQSLRKSVYLDMAVLLKSFMNVRNDDKKFFTDDAVYKLDRMCQFFVKEALNGGERPITSPSVMMEVFGDDPFLTYVFPGDVLQTYDYHQSPMFSPLPKITSDSGDVIFGKGGVESLSGPVSFYYLRPKRNVYEEGHGQYFPLIVLFGDAHFSLEKTCDPCVCSHDQTCCYSLSDPNFLRKLDTLAEHHPIDFYTETMLSGTDDGFQGGMMQDLTTGKMISCYHHRLRGTVYNKCPTTYIRWNAGETRHLQKVMKRHDNEEWFYHGKDYERQ